MRKRNDDATAVANIDQVAEQFKKDYTESKVIEARLNNYKSTMVDHAKAHPELLKDGKTLRHKCGTLVKKSIRVKPTFDSNKVTPDWLDAFLETDSCDAIALSFDPRRLRKDDVETARLLAEIGYEELVSTVWSVTVTTVEGN